MLLKLVHEDEDGREEQQDMQHLQTNTSVWRYRPRITVDHFFRQFHLQVEALKDMKNAFPVLKLLKEQVCIVFLFFLLLYYCLLGVYVKDTEVYLIKMDLSNSYFNCAQILTLY